MSAAIICQLADELIISCVEAGNAAASGVESLESHPASVSAAAMATMERRGAKKLTAHGHPQGLFAPLYDAGKPHYQHHNVKAKLNQAADAI